MEITGIRMTLLNVEGPTKAIGTITLDKEFCVKGVRVVETAEGKDFISFPSRETKDGTYEDIAFPMTKEVYKEMTDKILGEYGRLKTESQAQEKTQGLKEAEGEVATANEKRIKVR